MLVFKRERNTSQKYGKRYWINIIKMTRENIIPSHCETIECPNCNQRHSATIVHTVPFYTYVHTCWRCEYIITEGEWKKVEGYA